MENIRIRLAQAADQDAIVTCVRSAYSRYLIRMDREPAPMYADYNALIAQEVVYVLESEEGVRGILVMMPQNGSMFVENIAVVPRFQGQGLGKMLMAFVEQQAREVHLREISLYTNEVMTENLAFYQKLGFEEDARHVEDGYHRVFLRKQLM